MRKMLAALGLIVVLLSGTAWAKEINVPADFKKIGEALNNVSAGDVIKVAEGTYTENLTVTVSVTIEGASAEKTIIDGINGQGNQQPTVTIQGVENVTIRGFTIQNGGRRGIHIEGAKGVVIENSILRNNQTVGISVQSQSEVKILNNQIIETTKNTSGAGGRGLQIVDSQAVIAGNTIAKNAEIGVAILSSKAEIKENKINENGSFGISLNKFSLSSPTSAAASNGLITANTLSGNKGAGVSLLANSTAEMTKNQITNTQKISGGPSGLANGAGILIQDNASAKLTENTVSNNAGAGVAVIGGSAQLESNTIKDNQDCGVHGNRGTSITGSNNEISGNGGGGDLCGTAPPSIKK